MTKEDLSKCPLVARALACGSELCRAVACGFVK